MGLSASAGGPTLYLGRHMKTSQKGMGIDRDDYAAFKKHPAVTLEKFNAPERERTDVMTFILSLEDDIVEK
jgi:hypothetical protein